MVHPQVKPDDTASFVKDVYCLGIGVEERETRDFLHVLLIEGFAVKVLGEIHYWVCWIKYVVWIRCAGFRVLLLGHVEVVVCVVHRILGEG